MVLSYGSLYFPRLLEFLASESSEATDNYSETPRSIVCRSNVATKNF